MRRVHRQLDRIRRRRRVVPHGERSVRVQQGGDVVDARDDAGDVGGGREGADDQRPPVRLRLEQRLLERTQVGAALLRILGNRDDVGAAVAPREQVRVVLVRPDQHEGPLAHRAGRRSLARLGRRRDEAEERDEPVGAGRRARAREEEAIRVRLAAIVAAQVRLDHSARLRDKVGGLPARLGRRRVRIAVRRQDRLAHELLDEGERAARGGVVGVDERSRAKGRLRAEVGAQLAVADVLEEVG
mmetsp:Transcript_43872/g.141459  ORF Transcript_43872/g.141459 Transcript_43872/m.141459 type:complete len:243 (+) Transcript_43872:1069-1797(+)